MMLPLFQPRRKRSRPQEERGQSRQPQAHLHLLHRCSLLLPSRRGTALAVKTCDRARKLAFCRVQQKVVVTDGRVEDEATFPLLYEHQRRVRTAWYTAANVMVDAGRDDAHLEDRPGIEAARSRQVAFEAGFESRAGLNCMIEVR